MNAGHHERVAVTLVQLIEDLVASRTVRAAVPRELLNQNLTVNRRGIDIRERHRDIFVLHNLVKRSLDFVATCQKHDAAKQGNQE